MRFGGHETFAVREGWLPKGLRLLEADRSGFADPLASDALGVGRNMVKSIWHWLLVTGLIEKSSRVADPNLTSVAQAVLKSDKYFQRPGTWWALHLNLAAGVNDAVVWHWFFNRFYADRFDRIGCIAGFRRQLNGSGKRLPSPVTLSRDIACLLSSYAGSVPREQEEPEDGHNCPFRSLGLVFHLRESDTYRVNRNRKPISSAIVGYAFSKSVPYDADLKYIDLTLSQAQSMLNSPSKSLMLSSEAFLELLRECESDLGPEFCRIELSGAELMLRMKNLSPLEWLELYYDRGNR